MDLNQPNPRTDLLPDADGSLAESLPDGQLEEEEREALGEEHDPVGDQEGTFNGNQFSSGQTLLAVK